MLDSGRDSSKLITTFVTQNLFWVQIPGHSVGGRSVKQARAPELVNSDRVRFRELAVNNLVVAAFSRLVSINHQSVTTRVTPSNVVRS